jgi:hypothetical protein
MLLLRTRRGARARRAYRAARTTNVACPVSSERASPRSPYRAARTTNDACPVSSGANAIAGHATGG